MSASKPQPPITLRNSDLQKGLPVLRRAAQNARKLALRTGTHCYVWCDGRMVNIGAPGSAGLPGQADD